MPPLFRKKHSLHVVLSSDEETDSNAVDLCPHKRRNTVFVAKLLGGIGDVLGDKFSVPVQKEKW